MSASEAAREAAVVEGFPLSAQQAHLWSLGAGRAGGGSVFRAEGEISIRSLDGTLDARRITAALSAVVASTEILRTELRTVPGMSQPLQIVGGEPFAWRFERDLSGLSEAARIEALASVRADLDAAAPAGSPLDAALVRLAPESWLVRLRLPASAADGATLASLVTALGRSLAHLPAAEPFQYADYAAWQLDLAGSPETESARAFWRRQDLPALPPLRLPFERARAAAAPFAPAAFGFELALPEAALTPSFLLAAWQVLAARLSGVADLAVGVLCEGREFAELAGALGCFAEHLPVVARLAESDRFEQVARRAARALDQARASAVGFAWERLAEWTGAAGPMYPELAFEHAGERERFAASGVEIELLTSRVIGERFGLALAVARAGPGRAAAEIRYDAARFERADAVRVAGWLGALLADAAARPGAAIADLEILTAGERAESARAVRAGRIELPAACLHALVAARGARSPGRIAIEAEEGTLTYAELAAGARRLARRLAGLGVRAGEPVALLAERSLDLIVGMLGILEAGAAYVPLDPDHPFERRAGILDEIEPRAVVAQGGLAATLPAGGFALVAIDGMGEGPEADPQPAALDDLAYLIYTSGSTGRPKGVMVSHRAIANRLLWMERAFPLAPSDRVLHKTPASFDASIWEIFCPLVAGATLVLARPGGHQDSGYLAELAASAGITRLQLVPSQLAPFLDEPACALSTALADVFCGGEELPAALADRFAARLPARLHNLYGPTETAIDAACRPRVAPGLARVPIGRPIANVAIHLLNARDVPVPDGVPGEIAIGGTGLARGYFARPAATALGFVPDPFSGQAGARLYRTGDLARRTPESEIEYLGRIDRQVKVRGMRIELGEIEAVLAEVPGVARAIAAARPEAGGAGIRLVAWVVAAGGEPAPDLAALRERLRERLPAAMIPAAIVPLAALPLLPNGKLDAAALPSPEAFAAAEGAAFAAPRTPSEELLAVLWSEVLGASRIGRHDDFFDLGGHSLRATQLVSRIRKAFRVELPLRDLFRAPTVALLAARLDELRRAGAGPAAPPLRARERAGLPGEPLPLSFAQSRLWFYDRLNPGSSVFNLPVAILFRGRLDVPALARALGEIVDRHEVLRTTFRLADGEEPVQAIGEPWAVPLPTADLVALRTAGADRIEAETRRLLALEGARPFDLARGPLLRALLVRRGPDESVGLLNLHHIASDGWSTGVLVGEVAALYPALAAGRPSPLPELPIQYADFALWQRGWLAGETLAAEVAWWRERLAGAPERLEMPAGRPRPAALTYRGASVSRLAAQELGIALSALARRQGATPFMVAFAAGSLLVSWWTGERDLVIGTDVANRNRQETEGLIGFFVNQLALRVRLAPGSTFLDLLAEVREAALGAYAHQDLPFEQVVQALAPERSRAWSPLFQVKIDLHDTSALALELPGLEIGQLEVPRETAQLELILQVILGGDGRIRLAADFATDLFAPPAMARLLESFERLLGECTARPEAPLDELTAALTRAEREASLGEQRERRRARGAAFGGLRAGLADPDEARDAG